jgi:hypothetical protein
MMIGHFGSIIGNVSYNPEGGSIADRDSPCYNVIQLTSDGQPALQ